MEEIGIYNGFYRGIIKDIVDKKNGLYKVKIYPFFADVEDIELLPVAVSNFTNRMSHICLKKDDVVWVFFENGVLNYPIIFDLCNIKDKYPDGAKGSKPDFYNNITSDNNIDENNVSYDGEYNSVDSIYLGDNIKIDIDEKNKQIVIVIGDNYIVIDKDKNIHIKANGNFLKFSDKMGINVNNNIIKVNNSGIDIKSNSNSNLVMDSLFKLASGSGGNMNLLIQKILDCFTGLIADLSTSYVIVNGVTYNLNFSPINLNIKRNLADVERGNLLKT